MYFIMKPMFLGPIFTLAKSIITLSLSASVLLSTVIGQRLPTQSSSANDRERRDKMVADAFTRRAESKPVLPQGVTQGWYNSAQIVLQEREFFMQPLDRPGVFGAANHPQHLGYMFSGQGYSVKNFNDNGSAEGTWQASFRFASIGRGGQILSKPLRHVSQTGDRSLLYDYGDYAITYDNSTEGMEQAFLIKNRPAGRKPLRLVLSIDGDLEAGMGAVNQLLLYTAGHPKDIKLVYDQVNVFDKNNRQLAAHLEIKDKRHLVLAVDDKDAAYPVTVDPLNHTPTVTISGNHLVF